MSNPTGSQEWLDEDATPEFTPEQIEGGIADALHDRNFDVIPSLVKMLAVQDPRRAQVVLDALHGRVTLDAAAVGVTSTEEPR